MKRRRAMNTVMGEDVVAPAKVKEDLDRIRRDLAATLSNAGCRAHCFHSRWAATAW